MVSSGLEQQDKGQPINTDGEKAGKLKSALDSPVLNTAVGVMEKIGYDAQQVYQLADQYEKASGPMPKDTGQYISSRLSEAVLSEELAQARHDIWEEKAGIHTHTKSEELRDAQTNRTRYQRAYDMWKVGDYNGVDAFLSELQGFELGRIAVDLSVAKAKFPAADLKLTLLTTPHPNGRYAKYDIGCDAVAGIVEYRRLGVLRSWLKPNLTPVPIAPKIQ